MSPRIVCEWESEPPVVNKGLLRLKLWRIVQPNPPSAFTVLEASSGKDAMGQAIWSKAFRTDGSGEVIVEPGFQTAAIVLALMEQIKNVADMNRFLRGRLENAEQEQSG